MHYAFLVALMCSGFECQIDIVQQWQSSDAIEVVSLCVEHERQTPNSNCIFDSEEI